MITSLLVSMLLVITFEHVGVWADVRPEIWIPGEAKSGTFKDVCNKETIKTYNVLTYGGGLETSEACVMRGKDIDMAYLHVGSDGVRYGALVRPHGNELFGLLQRNQI